MANHKQSALTAEERNLWITYVVTKGQCKVTPEQANLLDKLKSRKISLSETTIIIETLLNMRTEGINIALMTIEQLLVDNKITTSEKISELVEKNKELYTKLQLLDSEDYEDKNQQGTVADG